jgi:hypoxanthine phosphoribosyltransferase
MEILLPSQAIQARVAELAREIAKDYQGQRLTIIGVLTGSLIFLADLIRHLELSIKINLIQASSYRGPDMVPGELRVNPDLVPEVRGCHVLLLDDILDTGQTLRHLTEHIRDLGAASLKVAVLLRKRGRQALPFEPDYCGFDIPNVFVVGYGLDFQDEYRHLPYIAILPAEISNVSSTSSHRPGMD